ncbi:MAG: permease-like cell division protein FtsX [Acidimicrobiia bacterium]|nr:permease-like cell division protein FtsX [Acidimicrobiia bacterium]MDX2465952.1 permease-like cell division protein FtsX [Acidimicrobiia bacterium]
MRITYVLNEAFNNIRRNGLVVLGAVLAVFVSLFLTFGTLIFGEIAKVNSEQWQEDVRVIGYVAKDFRDVEGLEAEIRSWPEVAEVIYFTPNEAVEEAQRMFADDQRMLEIIEDDPSIIPASLRVRPVDLNDYDTITQRLTNSPGITDVLSASGAVQQTAAIRDGLRIFFWVLAIALGAAAIALIANTIHMAIYARREELEIMQLVGASNWFVRTPFLIEGVVEGVFGSVLAVAAGVGLYRLALDRLSDLPDFLRLEISNAFLVNRGLLIIAFGAIVGIIGSGISLTVHKYVRT